ncbi:PAS domain S-box protein [Methanospirillum stamsii]|uniref:HTH arsR-type domain-containing protein n=1 Tax=Methanospirillum stamsii TaxID=1277351 RepID=A0A2V2MNC7_9EURY|nr:PAS domain S-box protein [Methanospirillum stamsii]PWR69592.1 hypothetical protein DLD82_17625 [Methanospirillum stamsii]
MDVEQKKILSILSQTKKPLMIKDIAELSGINRHTVARKLDTLEILGRVRKFQIGSAKKYSLTETVPVSSLIDISNDLIIILNEKWHVHYMNKSALNFFHLSDQPVIGKRIDFLRLDIFSSPEVIQGIKEFSFQKVTKIELEIQKNGLDLWYEITIMNISLKPGSLFIAVTASNVTEKVITQRKLIENEAIYRSLFENAPIPINKVDISQVKQYIDTLKRSGIVDIRSYFEQNPDEIIKCSHLIKVRKINKKSHDDYQVVNGDYSKIMEFMTPYLTKETIDSFKNLFISLYEGSNYFQFPSSFVTSKGIKRHFLNFVADASPQNDLSRIYFSYLEVTGQKSLQLQLLQNNKDLIGVTEEVIAHDAEIRVQIDELRNQRNDAEKRNILHTHLLDATHIPIIMFNSSMVITWTSTEMNYLCGYADTGLYGENLRTLFSDNSEFEQFYLFITQNELIGRYTEVSLLHQSGNTLSVLWHHVENITLSDGKKTYAAMIQKIDS